MSYKLSIITICFDEVSSIRRTIESVLLQTYADFEYIVIDGNSSDGTTDIIAEFKDNIDIFISEPDSGIYNAMNKGLRKAKGDYVIFLNGGDYFTSNNVIKNVINHLADYEIVFGDIIKSNSSHENTTSLSKTTLDPFTFFTHTLPHQGTFIKRELFNRFGLYDESFQIMGDYEFFKRVIVKFKVKAGYIPITIAIFNTDGISSNPRYRRLQKREAARARLMTYGLFRFLFFTILWSIYDSFYYRPKRKINHLLGKN